MTRVSHPRVIPLDGVAPDRSLIGGKAWSIASIKAMGFNVPPAFVITTEACRDYFSAGTLPSELTAEIDGGMAWLEDTTSRHFGRGPSPLLVSVRSGAAVSMPGMMDTILNLGITDETEAMLAAEWGNSAFARDLHRRFLESFAKIVLKVPALELRASASPAEWREAIASMAGVPVLTEVRRQIGAAVRAVFDSWDSVRARRYRKHHGISDDLGTAVTVQSMVFGNLDEQSGTGVLFSRNPLTGENRPYGEYLTRAQGEEIVSGTRTPVPLHVMREQVGDALDELLSAARALEKLHRDAQDIEFTVERGKLYLLQTRSAKRAPQAAVYIATAMVDEGYIEPREALERVSPEQVRLLLRPRLQPGAAAAARIIARGEGASPGVGRGMVVTDPSAAEALAKRGDDIVLARESTSPDDVHGMIAARAAITEHGGTTSHAAVVARALGRPCVVGCGSGTVTSLVGQSVTVDGEAGLVYEGNLPLEVRFEDADPALVRLMDWAMARAPIAVVASAPSDSAALDIDRLADVRDPGALRHALASLPKGSCVRGMVFSADSSAVHAAIECGVATIVTYPRLPALLAAVQWQEAKHRES